MINPSNSTLFVCYNSSVDENFCIRGKESALLLANQILDEEGNLAYLDKIAAQLEREGFFQNREFYSDSDITEHQLRVLKALQKNARLRQQLLRFGLPLCDAYLEKILQLLLGKDEELQDRDVICAVLSSLLCPLRQSVGSCFGTAPAILVHEEYMEIFLEDLSSLLSKGQLTRVLSGVEYTVPLSPSPGLGSLKKQYKEDSIAFKKAIKPLGLTVKNHEDKSYLEVLEELLLEKFELNKRDLRIRRTLRSEKLFQIEQMQIEMLYAKWRFVAHEDHLLLKMWEFTIASFADVKTEFSRWNLFSSLGLHPDEKGGIGELVYRYLEEKLEEASKKLEHFQQALEISFDQVRTTESLMRAVSSESEARRLKAEHLSRLYHMRSCEEMRDTWAKNAQATADFFPFFIESIIAKFQEYFQEVYDPEMQDVKAAPYDDSPAGFRLLFKHGRVHVGSWTFIHNKEEYIDALKAFFLQIEHSLIDACTWPGGKEEIPQLITAIIHLILTDDFLIQAFLRLAKAHRVPLKKITLDELEQMEKKPWSYTSGGTVPTLVKTYFRREGSLSEEIKWVESPIDLLVFILETLKMLPPWLTLPFIQNPKKRMLMTSPTHAFSLLPGLFKEGWEDPGFTYTFVRDQLLIPGQEFYRWQSLDARDQIFLLQEFAKRLPPLEAHHLQQSYSVDPQPIAPGAFAKKVGHPRIDAYLFESLPLIKPQSAAELGIQTNTPLTRRALHDLLVAKHSLNQDHDVHAKVQETLISKKLAPPRPFIFADSNWAKAYFAFAVNPATFELDLFRTDKIGLTGAPLKEWAPFFRGSHSDTWSIYLRTYEYSY